MAERKKLGDLLVEAGLIDKFQLASALSHQRNWGGKLGAILIDMEFVRESELAQVLSDKLRIPYEDLFQRPVAGEILALLKAELAKKHGVMPVRRDGRSLVLAMSDPLDIDATDEVRFITGLSIKPVLAMESEIQDAIKKYYYGEEITRQEQTTIQERLKASPDTMELTQTIAVKAQIEHTLPSWERPDKRKDAVPDRLLVDALISLMLDKEMITVDELARMIELKKKWDYERVHRE